MIENIHWLGHDTFRLDGSSTVYIDPWKLSAGAPRADVVLVTHDHFDHFSPRRHRPRGRSADDAHRAGVGDRRR